ncbi:hypothetical protein GGR52DRAFT_322327 [Hypoxylon sp. FL1284]|nr:hypothetical protein GGR52DRAFT_322327 [Hypoxylon sp. FL1284]
MSPPTERLQKLSLESMPPTTRLQSRLRQAEVEEEESSVVSDYSSPSSSDTCSEPEFDIDEEDEEVMVSPSRLRYRLDQLDDEARGNVARATEVPAQFVLRGCQAGDERCLFLVTEPAEYTVRTGSPASGYGEPSCTCEDSERGETPCRHVLWLLDQVTSQVLGARPEPYTLTRHGYPAELGNPYDAIADFHLDTLADSLHCDVVGQSASPNPRRVRETREILALLSDVPVDEYRPDLFGDGNDDDSAGRRRTGGKRKRDGGGGGGDLEQTVFRMLLRNDELFRYFLSATSARAGARAEARIRELGLRADAVLAGLWRYADEFDERQREGKEEVTADTHARPKDVPWAAAHLASVARQLRSAVYAPARPLGRRALRAAARVAAGVLARVVLACYRDVGPPGRPQNLYRRLVDEGDNDNNYAPLLLLLDVLAALPPRVLAPWVDDLAAVERGLAERGGGGGEVTLREALRELLAPFGSRGAALAGSKRTGGSGSSGGGGGGGGGQAQAQDRRVKRPR